MSAPVLRFSGSQVLGFKVPGSEFRFSVLDFKNPEPENPST
jgi:hypothetical protein